MSWKSIQTRFQAMDHGRKRLRTTNPAGQYSLAAAGAVWLAAALPGALLAWIVAPALAGRAAAAPGLSYWLLNILSGAWQTTLGMWLIARQEGGLRWENLRRGARYTVPVDPVSDRPRRRAFAWLLLAWPCIAIVLTVGVLLSQPMFMRLFARDGAPAAWDLSRYVPSYSHVTELASPEFGGQRLLLPLAVLSWVLSVVFGEELVFRGVLLPRMRATFGRWDWAANGLLSGLSALYKPWMIPFRTVEGLVVARLAGRYRSTWLAIGARAVEGLGLLGVVLWGVAYQQLPALPAPLVVPYVAVHPEPAPWYRGALQALPAFDLDRYAPWQVDLRGVDLSALDLGPAQATLLRASYDTRTVWPPAERLPAGFDPQAVLETGKNPGLGVRSLHARGITGRGVTVAIIDQRLLTDHAEYAQRLRWYEEIGPGLTAPDPHGPAVASLAVGQTVGVAPGADLYYIGVNSDLSTMFLNYHHIAQAVRRITEINQALPPGHKISVLSMSTGWAPSMPGYYDLTSAVAAAKAEGIFVISTSATETYGFRFRGLERSPLADPDDLASYGPALWWASTYERGSILPDALLVPLDSRTFAGRTGVTDYVFDRAGGESWSVPLIAGTYALAAQVDPQITPERFWAIALQTGHALPTGAGTLRTVIDPVALIQEFEAED